MHIHTLEVEGVRRIKHVTIEPSGAVTIIGGKNGQGKSSLIAAVEMLFGGKKMFGDDPVNRNVDVAVITCDIGEFKITRRIVPSGETTVKIEASDGHKVGSPETFLQSLFDSLTFDPSAFLRMDARQQLETLRKVVGLDTSALDQERAKVYAERTQIGRDVDSAKKQLDAAPAHHDDAPKEEVSAEAIVADLDDANRHNNKINLIDAQGKEVKATIERLERELAEARQKRETLIEARKLAISQRKDVGADGRVDTAAISDSLSSVEKTNKKVRENARREELKKAWNTKSAEYDAKSKRISEIDDEKKRLIAEARFPVDGLSIDDDGVKLNGVAFANASTAEKLRVSFALACAKNPKLRVAMIREGSMFDEDSLALIASLAEETGTQVFMERVGKGQECSIIIQDGEVLQTTSALRS
jgi:hypothetical protein